MTEIQSLDQNCSAEDVTRALARDGCVIIKELNSAETMDQIQCELDRYIARSKTGECEFWGHNTRRFGALVTKSRAFGEHCAANSRLLEVMDRILGPRCDRYQLHVTMMVGIGPGEVPQPLHRDDGLLPFTHPGPQALCNTMWAMSDFTAENGATNIIPGSHNWPDDRLPSAADPVVQAVMPRGSCLIYLGSVWHGGALNRTVDKWRTGLICGYSLGWLRQEENMYLSVPPQVAKNLPETLQHLIGYRIHGQFLGWVEAQDPHVVLEEHYDEVMPAVQLQSRMNLKGRVFKTASLGDPEWFDCP